MNFRLVSAFKIIFNDTVFYLRFYLRFLSAFFIGVKTPTDTPDHHISSVFQVIDLLT